jgi:hypothetical protein
MDEEEGCQARGGEAREGDEKAVEDEEGSASGDCGCWGGGSLQLVLIDSLDDCDGGGGLVTRPDFSSSSFLASVICSFFFEDTLFLLSFYARQELAVV